MSKPFLYHTCCVSSTTKLIEQMVDDARQITYRTFSRYVDIKTIEREFSYKHLRLKDDYAVSFYKSKYDGKPCYYMYHSAIEYVYLRTPMTDNQLETIAVNRAEEIWGVPANVISLTHEGNLPSVRINVESENGNFDGMIWIDKDTGVIEQEDLD